jgi:archaetidylinositol phosphate synthase
MLDTHGRRFVQPIIQQTAQTFLNFGWTATGVTWAAFIIGLGAGVLVWLGLPVLAVITLWISGFLDAVDGTMARIAKRTSPWGTLLDITFDRVVELTIIIALGLRYPEALFLLLVLTASIVFSMTIFLTVGALSEKQGYKSFYYQAGLAERTEGFLFLSVMVLFPAALLWSTGIFIIVEIFTGVQRLLEGRRLLKSS